MKNGVIFAQQRLIVFAVPWQRDDKFNLYLQKFWQTNFAKDIIRLCDYLSEVSCKLLSEIKIMMNE